MTNRCDCERCAVKEQLLRYISTYTSITGERSFYAGNIFSGIAQHPVCADRLTWNLFSAVLDEFKAEGLCEHSPFDLRSARQTTTHKKQPGGEANANSN